MARVSRRLVLGLAAVGVFLASVGLVRAGAHTWRVNELFSNATGTIQFVELRECCGGPGENFVGGHPLSSSLNPTYTIPANVVGNTSNKTILFATPAFAALPGAPTPDFIFPAGMVPFFAIGGDSIAYTYDNMAFAGGALPTDGRRSLNDVGGVNVVACNSPKNFAGQTASLNLNCAMQGDIDGNGSVDGFDISAFVRIALGTPLGGDNPACADYCGANLAANMAAFVADLLD